MNFKTAGAHITSQSAKQTVSMSALYMIYTPELDKIKRHIDSDTSATFKSRTVKG
jgi:hypothetical protein